ncbi:pilus assembly protein [Nocardioides sp. Kera G14]|nr:TadE family protein [Nocardioides sp. Kera G14]UDY23808.1 pilus assembly protein [Nocardioides sp. Kera G14]
MRGAATAELVVALPVLVALTIAMAWFVSLGLAQVRVVDAARETARALARGDDRAAAVARGRDVGPDGTTLSVSGGSDVRVTASARVSGPGGVLRLVAITLHATAVAAHEE